MKPNESKRQVEVSKKLHSVLRCIHLVLQSYLKHLPLSGGQVFPKSLFYFTNMCRSFADSANSLGLTKECSNLREDTERLVKTAETFKRKFEEAAKPKEPTINMVAKKTVKKTVKKAAVVGTKSNAEIIQKLAKEKFGAPRTSSIPDRRVSLSKVKGDDAIGSEAVLVTSNKSNDHANSTLMDGESLANDYFTNNSNREQLQIFNHLKSIKEDNQEQIVPISNVSKSPALASIVTDRRSLSQLSIDDHRSSMILKPAKSDRKCIKSLEIDDEELADIEDLRHRTKLHELKSMPPSVAHLHPLELVSSIADRVVRKIVHNVCHEAVDPHLIEKLVQAELVAN